MNSRRPHRIYLLRHAKSSWDDPSLPDRERPLAKRGHKAVKVLARHFRRAGVEPELVLCSSAARASQTLDGVREGLPPAAEVVIEEGLYAAGASSLLRRLQGLDEEIGSVMLVGHNPAIEELASDLAGEGGDADARGRMERKYPTGALATLVFDAPWRELDSTAARLEGFAVPRELE